MCSETQDTRVCRSCGIEKPLTTENFYPRRDGVRRDRFRQECRECWKESQLVKRVGIDYAQYHEMLKRQDHRCDICKCRLESSRYTKFSVDHCHKTGKVRGLLCSPCNTALGLFKESPERLEHAIRYLLKHSREDIV